jgi:phosphatidylinositol alpha-mannosyltransferase
VGNGALERTDRGAAMRILQVCPYAMERRGGVQNHVRDIARWLAAAGHEVTIVAPGPGEEGGDASIVPLGRHLSIGLSGTRFEVTWVGNRELAEALRRLDAATIDIVHVHTPFVPALPYRVWRAFGRPTVATFHATLPPQDRLLRAVLGPVARRMRDRAAAAIAVSPSAAELLKPERRDRPIDLLPPAIDLSAWRAAGQAATEAATGAPVDRPRRVLFLGRFEARKGLDVLVEAWPEIVRRGGDVPPELIIAGGGELGPLAEGLVARGAGRVRIVDTPDDATARRLVAEADLFVSPAPWGESFGLVLIEAMAAGTPVVAAANPGYAGVLTGPGAASLVPPGDAAALARVVSDLLADADRLRVLRAWGCDHVKQFDVAAVGPRLVDVYRRVTMGR